LPDPATDSKKVAATLRLPLCALETQIPASLRLIPHCFGIAWDRRPGVAQWICGTFSLTLRHWTSYPPVRREKANSLRSVQVASEGVGKAAVKFKKEAAYVEALRRAREAKQRQN
jgi:hypothetical protein